MKKYEVTIRSPRGSDNNITKVEALARNGIDAACHVLHLLGNLEGGSFSVFVKPAKVGVAK